jgi:hypothetical protein
MDVGGSSPPQVTIYYIGTKMKIFIILLCIFLSQANELNYSNTVPSVNIKESSYDLYISIGQFDIIPYIMVQDGVSVLPILKIDTLKSLCKYYDVLGRYVLTDDCMKYIDYLTLFKQELK